MIPSPVARFRLLTFLVLAGTSTAQGQQRPTLEIELEAGPVWQTRNDVQVPNDQAGTRFSLVESLGKGPWATGRLYVTWNVSRRHAVRALLAPFAVTGTGRLNEPVAFAGEGFPGGETVEGTYRFNSWRLSYRYRFADRPGLQLWVGLTAKVRDAEIRLRRGGTTARNTDVGFVPLVHLAAEWTLAPRSHLLFDFDGLAGGPGRAFDAALELGYDLNARWRLSGGYRTLEGGADVDTVYAFAWFHYGVVSLVFRY